MDKKLAEMEHLARKIKSIQNISNTILANACYHTKEMENQISMAEKTGRINQEEKDIVCQAWNKRNMFAHELMSLLKKYLEEK